MERKFMQIFSVAFPKKGRENVESAPRALQNTAPAYISSQPREHRHGFAAPILLPAARLPDHEFRCPAL
jgi:hypothetical protein